MWRVIDREDMAKGRRKEKIEERIRVRGRREIENYLYDPEVLKTFLSLNKKEDLAENILNQFDTLLSGETIENADVKKVSRELFEIVRKLTRISYLGNTREGIRSRITWFQRSKKLHPCIKNYTMTSFLLYENCARSKALPHLQILLPKLASRHAGPLA